jgi:hypothetical protein
MAIEPGVNLNDVFQFLDIFCVKRAGREIRPEERKCVNAGVFTSYEKMDA